jgi:hypothetical protein
MDMDNFYKLGQDTALEKLGQGGLFKSLGAAGKSIGSAAKGGWEAMGPAAQGIVKRLGVGGGVGAAGGALAGGEEHRGMGALLGGGLGALGMAGLGHHLQGRAMKRLTKDIMEGSRYKQIGRNLVEATPEQTLARLEKMKPVAEQATQHLQRKTLPGLF